MSDRRTMSMTLLTGLTLALSVGCSGNRDGAEEVDLKGSGSTFVEPICKKWCSEFSSRNKGVNVTYSGGGSGKGIADFTKGLTTFGASDAAMSDDEIAKVEDKNVVLIPIAAGKVVLTYNIDAVDNLKLSRDTYAGIFLGDITKWSDDKIKKDNPNARLPDANITVVVRSDGSGTTFAFTNHLSAISPKFRDYSGPRKEYKKPTGFIAAKGNSAVMGQIKNIPNSIGYVEYGYARESKTPMASLQNKTGEFIAPSPESGAAALAGEKFPDDMRLFITDPGDRKAYPIVSYVWLLVKKKNENEKTASKMRDFIKFCLNEGQEHAIDMGYLKIQERVAKEIWAYAEMNVK